MAAYIALSLSESNVNIAANTSVVTANLYYYGNGTSYNYNNPSGTIYIDGAAYSFSHDFTKSTSAQWIGSASRVITHNSDGSRYVSCSASFATGVSLGTLSTSAGITLTTIPRASDLSVDVDTIPADGVSKVIATATKKSASFTDVLTVSLGSYSKTIASGTAFTIPLEWNNAIAGTSAVATVKVETFTGTTSVGTKTVDLTITVPDSVVPVINDVGITEAVAAVTNAFGNRFVQNLSQLNVEVDASGVYGSTIKSYSVTLDGVNYIQQAFTSNVIKTAGTLDIKVKITDSRGRSAEDTATVDIVEYIKPTITSMVYAHCNSDGTPNSSGTSTKVTIAGRVYPVANQNTKALKLKYKSMADSSYTERVVTISDWTFSVDVIINNTDPTVTYEYIAELTDKINADSPETFRVTTGKVVLSRKTGGTGVTIGGEASEDGFVVANGWDALFTGDIYVSVGENLQSPWELAFGTQKNGQFNLIDVFYHIGMVIPTESESFDPNELFPWQKWERFAQGRTLVGVDENDEDFASAGLELGEKEHLLTKAELPKQMEITEKNNGDWGFATQSGIGGSQSVGYHHLQKLSYSTTNNITAASGVLALNGGNQPHNNIQPSVTVYYWKRTA